MDGLTNIAEESMLHTGRTGDEGIDGRIKMGRCS
jgi:hypothetical protein